MKKIVLSILATVIMSSVTVYAGGKKQSTKAASKKEVCSKDCKTSKDCPTTGQCPGKPCCSRK
jgi:hypothetical protein